MAITEQTPHIEHDGRIVYFPHRGENRRDRRRMQKQAGRMPVRGAPHLFRKMRQTFPGWLEGKFHKADG